MKKENKEATWPVPEQVEKARAELRKTIMQEELECALRLEILDSLMSDLQVDPASFSKLWIQPLLATGVSLEVALRCIAKSRYQPN